MSVVLHGSTCPHPVALGSSPPRWCVANLAARLSRVTADHTDIDPAFAEFADLWGADTADALHRVLVLHPLFRSTADAFEPFQLLTKHHEGEPETSTVTALLLLTDRRWSNGVSRLVHKIAESGMISEDDLALLANLFVDADDYLYWELPEAWLGDGDWVDIDIRDPFADAAEAGSDPGAGAEAAADEDQPTVAARPVYPPLRRWAATYLVGQDTSRWGALLSIARRRRGAAGAAIMRGLLDAVGHLPDRAQKLVVDTGTAWPKADVRKQALQLLADRGDRPAAYDIAEHDTSAAVRRWAPSLLEPLPGSDTAPDHDQPRASPQGQLFST